MSDKKSENEMCKDHATWFSQQKYNLSCHSGGKPKLEVLGLMRKRDHVPWCLIIAILSVGSMDCLKRFYGNLFARV